MSVVYKENLKRLDDLKAYTNQLFEIKFENVIRSNPTHATQIKNIFEQVQHRFAINIGSTVSFSLLQLSALSPFNDPQLKSHIPSKAQADSPHLICGSYWSLLYELCDRKLESSNDIIEYYRLIADVDVALSRYQYLSLLAISANNDDLDAELDERNARVKECLKKLAEKRFLTYFDRDIETGVLYRFFQDTAELYGSGSPILKEVDEEGYYKTLRLIFSEKDPDTYLAIKLSVKDNGDDHIVITSTRTLHSNSEDIDHSHIEEITNVVRISSMEEVADYAKQVFDCIGYESVGE